jgi:hypothetical protein
MGVVTGVFELPNGSPVASGLYQWKLSSDAVELGIGCFAPMLITGLLDVNGNMTATFIFNDKLVTAAGTNTTYQLTVKDLGGRQVWNENYFLTGTAANLNTVLPGSGPPGAIYIPSAVILGADSVQSIAVTSGVGFAAALNSLIEVTSGTGITMTAVSAVGVSGQTLRFIKVDTATAVAVLIGTSGQTFSGKTSLTFSNQWQAYQVESDNANWMVTASAG